MANSNIKDLIKILQFLANYETDTTREKSNHLGYSETHWQIL